MSMATQMFSTGQAQALAQHLTPAQRKHLPVSILPKPNPAAQPKQTVPKLPPPAQNKTQHAKEPSAPAKRIKDVVKSAKKHKKTVKRKQPKKTASNQPPTTKPRTPSPSGSGDESDCPLVIDESRDTTEPQTPGTDGDGFQKARKTARLPAPQQVRAILPSLDMDTPVKLTVTEKENAPGCYEVNRTDLTGSQGGMSPSSRLPLLNAIAGLTGKDRRKYEKKLERAWKQPRILPKGDKTPPSARLIKAKAKKSPKRNKKVTTGSQVKKRKTTSRKPVAARRPEVADAAGSAAPEPATPANTKADRATCSGGQQGQAAAEQSASAVTASALPQAAGRLRAEVNARKHEGAGGGKKPIPTPRTRRREGMPERRNLGVLPRGALRGASDAEAAQGPTRRR
ncbi:serine/arginine repetitive matrix protein 1-like [Schistocerca piceifrons]|uniref:serine/arginine repetitive matrix protein 1-like n=1 Tax=Schistocerca piceifrons TaxID=274613 RepID=UPI001F5FD943|nr:serine/arginine repetitive matrix protein 1-like [Schistocerca piceifrons]